MLEGFLAFPLWLIVLISIGVPVIIVIPVVKAIFNARIRSEGDDTEGLVAVFGFIGTAFTLLLAFTIVNVWSDQVSQQNILFDETTTLESIIIETRAFDPKLAPTVKGLTIDYLESVRKYEIDTDPPSGGDPRAGVAFEKLLEEFNILEKNLESDNRKAEAQIILEEVKQLVDDRVNRVSGASGILDGMTTLVCIILAILTVLTMALLPAPSRRWIKWVQSLGVAVSVGLVMSLVFYIASDDYTRKAEDEQIRRVEQTLELQQSE
jgi:amino acid transporter